MADRIVLFRIILNIERKLMSIRYPGIHTHSLFVHFHLGQVKIDFFSSFFIKKFPTQALATSRRRRPVAAAPYERRTNEKSTGVSFFCCALTVLFCTCTTIYRWRKRRSAKTILSSSLKIALKWSSAERSGKEEKQHKKIECGGSHKL